MNLWIFNHYAITPDLPGGTRHFDLARELVRRGHRVTIFASSFHHYLRREMKLASGERWKAECVEGVTFVWLKTWPAYQRNDWRRVLNMISFMLRVWRLGRRLPKLVPEIGKPDVVIGSSVHLLAVLAAYRVARYHRAKFLMEVRDLWPEMIIDMGRISKRHSLTKLLQGLERFLYRRADRIITLWPYAHEYIVTCGVPLQKIAWIPNGVDLSRFNSISQAKKQNNKFKIMYLGAHGEANALDVLLQAAKIIHDQDYKDIRLILIGDGPKKPRLIELAKELDLGNVKFREPVQKTDVPKILREADAFIFNLVKAETFKYGISPNKLFDCLAAGKPIIFSVEARNNPIEEAHCGLSVPPQAPQALAEAIVKLYQMAKKEREAMGRRGREYVEKHHAIPVLAEKLMRCIEDI